MRTEKCKFNEAVDCGEQNGCGRCGWNPHARQRKVTDRCACCGKQAGEEYGLTVGLRSPVGRTADAVRLCGCCAAALREYAEGLVAMARGKVVDLDEVKKL